MSRYDQSFDALFNPGHGSDYFQADRPSGFGSSPERYSPVNAWWAAEFCRLTYRIDDQLRAHSRVGDDVHSVLDRIGYRIASILTDSGTSSLAVRFTPAPDTGLVTAEAPDLLVFCGSNEALDWKMNMQAVQQQWHRGARVHRGFLKSFTSLAEQVVELAGPERALLLSGHSLGAALATLASVELSSRDRPATACYSFGCPRIGNSGFVNLLSEKSLFRLVNGCDIVTGVPVSFGATSYLQGPAGIYFDPQGAVLSGLDDEEIQRRQLTYIPELKKYATLSLIIDRLRTLPVRLPRYLADHAIINYRFRLEAEGSSD